MADPTEPANHEDADPKPAVEVTAEPVADAAPKPAAERPNVYEDLRAARPQAEEPGGEGENDGEEFADIFGYGAEEEPVIDPLSHEARMVEAANIAPELAQQLRVGDVTQPGEGFAQERLRGVGMVDPLGGGDVLDIGEAYVAPLEPLYAAADHVANGWMAIGNLPGYLMTGRQDEGVEMAAPVGGIVRALGRTIFSNFPCYRAMAADALGEARDELGEIQVIVGPSAPGFHDPDRVGNMLNALAWLDENISVESNLPLAQMDFDGVFPGYLPEVTFKITDDRTFLVVHESRGRGAPADNTAYVYTWPGGHAHYDNSPGDLDKVRALRHGAVDSIAIAPAARPAAMRMGM